LINKTYKYTAVHEQFFENLLIRASQKYALNDPFELSPGSNDISLELAKVGNKAKRTPSYDDYAIISFTETYNNLLMWSHYANQHQGIVIEFDPKVPMLESYVSDLPWYVDEDDEEVMRLAERDEFTKNLNEGVMQRVHYNSLRPDKSSYESVLEHFLIKSDAWIYEKEKRVIVPLIKADYMIIKKKYLELVEFTLGNPEKLVKVNVGDDFVKISLDDCLKEDAAGMFVHYRGDNLTEEDFFNILKDTTFSEYLSVLSKDPTSIFLYKIPALSIKKIYLGCRMTDEQKYRIKIKIKENRNLEHVEIKELTIDMQRFELNILNK